MILFELPRVIYPLVSFSFGVHCGVSISLYAGKGKCCMWPLNKVEIHSAKIYCVDSKWSNLNATGGPGSYTPWCYLLFLFTWCLLRNGNGTGRARPMPSESSDAGGGPRSWTECMQEKDSLHVACEESGNSFFKNRVGGLQMVQFECPRVRHPLALVYFTFSVHYGLPFSLHAKKGKCVLLTNRKSILQKVVLWTPNG